MDQRPMRREDHISSNCVIVLTRKFWRRTCRGSRTPRFAQSWIVSGRVLTARDHLIRRLQWTIRPASLETRQGHREEKPSARRWFGRIAMRHRPTRGSCQGSGGAKASAIAPIAWELAVAAKELRVTKGKPR